MDILFTGVGGQGILFASELVARAAILNGLDVKKSEIHGMAQRGGSVVSGVRFGKKVYSPLIEKADIICSFELIESLRNIRYLKAGGRVFINNQRIVPMTAFIGNIPYPDDPILILKEYTQNFTLIDGLKIAKSLGDPRLVNVIMVGAISTAIGFTEQIWYKVIEEIGKSVEINKKAFKEGKDAACRMGIKNS
jgi:indolepyruvate ferredoxin oxidoreductase beta subunit